MLNEPHIETDAPRRSRRWRVGVFFIGWTILAGGIAWLLSHSSTIDDVQPQLLFDGRVAATATVSEQIHRWLRIADLNFRGAYPWILLAPYVLWLAWHFLLERGRLRTSLPVHVAACALFAAASYGLDSHVMKKASVVMMVSDHRQGTFPWGLLTNEIGGQTGDIVEDREEHLSGLDSPIKSIRTRVIHATNGVFGTLEVSPDTNFSFATTTVARANAFLTNWNSDPGPMLGLAGGGMSVGSKRSGSGEWFSSTHAVARYDTRLFSHLLNILAYGSLAGLAHAVHFYRFSRERDRRAALLESHLAKARLHALQAQLQPHFLFNALNAVATLLRSDARAAQDALTSFSELLRLALSQSDKQEVTLREDMRFVERYIEIQQTRLGDRLRFEQQIDSAALECLVPTLFLQPLVENALRHGIEPSPGPGLVRVSVHRESDQLRVTIEDNGVGLSAEGNKPGGIGLQNLRARLLALYGQQHKMDVLPRTEGGVIVRIEIPIRMNSTNEATAYPAIP